MEKFLSLSLPFWDNLLLNEKEELISKTKISTYNKGTIFYHAGGECSGVEIVKSGRARVYLSSPDGREITLYRILDNDLCMMSASCMIKNINFAVSLETEADSEIALIPSELYKRLVNENIYVKNYTLELMASKFSEVMWLLEQLVFSNMGSRLAGALLEQADINNTLSIEITHEKIATDLGTAREVVTRLLRQFQVDGLVHLSRGKIEILMPTYLKNMIK